MTWKLLLSFFLMAAATLLTGKSNNMYNNRDYFSLIENHCIREVFSLHRQGRQVENYIYLLGNILFIHC